MICSFLLPVSIFEPPCFIFKTPWECCVDTEGKKEENKLSSAKRYYDERVYCHAHRWESTQMLTGKPAIIGYPVQRVTTQQHHLLRPVDFTSVMLLDRHAYKMHWAFLSTFCTRWAFDRVSPGLSHDVTLSLCWGSGDWAQRANGIKLGMCMWVSGCVKAAFTPQTFMLGAELLLMPFLFYCTYPRMQASMPS